MSRREEILRKQGDRNWIKQVVLAILFLLTGIWFGFKVGEERFTGRSEDFHLNLWTEAVGVLAGAGISALVIDQLNVYRNRQREDRETKARLLRELRWGDNSAARIAIGEMHELNWLQGDDGLLKGAALREADLRGKVNLSDSNLEKINLEEAVLFRADLSGSNLQAAKLFMAHLELSKLIETDLRGANLMGANLSGACVVGAKLQGAYLLNATIKGPFFGIRIPPQISSGQGSLIEYPPTILPDGKEYVEGMSLDRFTNDKHPEFPQTLKDINEIRKCMGLYIVGESMYDEQNV